MKNQHLPKALIATVAFCFLLSACGSRARKITAINPAFSKYISGYTSGNISRKTVIRIELAQSILSNASATLNTGDPAKDAEAAAKQIVNAMPDSNLLKELIVFEPEIKGKAVMTSDRVLEFTPDSALPSNQFYDAELKLGKLLKVEKELEDFTFQFSTFPQNMFVTVNGLRSYDNNDIEWQRLQGSITTSDYEDSQKLEKTITVTQNGKKVPVRVYTVSTNEFGFEADSIKRGPSEGTVTVNWDGSAIDAPAKGSSEAIVPALGDFYVTNAVVNNDDDQSVDLTFSDPILSAQKLKGIITITGVEGLTYSILGNLVKVYLPNRIIGDKTIGVSTGIKNFKGYKMNNPYSTGLTFEEPKPLVRVKGNGTILPNSSGLIFPFEAVGLKAVTVRILKIYENNVHQFLQTNNLSGSDDLYRVGKVMAEKKIALDYNKKANLKEWNTHVIDLRNMITPEPGAIYRISIKFDKDDALCDCSNTESEASENEDYDDGYYEEVTNTGQDETWNENTWYSWGSDNGYQSWGGYDNNYGPCNQYYYRGKAVSRNILASDLGLIYKQDDSHVTHAFVSNLITAQPVANARVEYYDFTKQLLGAGNTNSSGMLDLELKNKPFLMVAKWGQQRGYLKLGDGLSNSLSKFDIEGEVVQKGVKGFIYGERGVWRPGDSLYLNFILEDKDKRLPAGHPVKFELQDPNGQVVYTVTKTKHLNGVYDFRTNTSAEAPTGNYTAKVKIGNRQFMQTVKIETVKPNRLKIYINFGSGKKDSVAKITAKWLHGAVARNLHTTINVSMNQTETSFGKYRDYVFDSPIRSYYTESEYVFDGTLNEKGEAEFSPKSVNDNTAPGMLRATYLTKVFEEGGDFSIDRISTNYSPYNTYIGLCSPETDTYDHTLETGKGYNFKVVALNENGALSDAQQVQVKIYKIQWRWWYERSYENLTEYISRNSATVVKDTMLKTQKGISTFRFGTNFPEYGRYLITVTDLKGGHQTGTVVQVDWPYWSRGNRSGNENANMLNFSSDKAKYMTGETIKLSIPSPASGMALVSIESGSKVLNKFWIPTKKGETVYQLAATPNMAPNAYVHITLVQPHSGTKNDLPIRMYGVVPVLVDNPATHLEPEIKMPEVIAPESTVKINVKEKNGKKMNYTLAMVDEGLLDLTRFKTPQPWNTFYAREALGVKTWDMYDDVIGAFAGKLDKLLSLGGDGDGAAGKSVKANRFKPMVKFMGPFTLEAGSEKQHQIAVPNYVGSVRVMVVAANEGAYGNSEKTVAVRKPLMVLATLPRVLGPGEVVYLPVDVFAMEKHVKDVKVEITVNDLMTINGSGKQTIHFRETGDEVVNFKLAIAPKTGIAKVKVIATSGSEKAIQEIELDVRPSNPKVTNASDFTVDAGKEIKLDFLLKGLSGTNKATLEFSELPALGLESRLTYLIQYPHGCIEQTTSSVFPQLFLSALINMSEEQKRNSMTNIKAGINRLQLFQTVNGGFSYWPGEGYDSEWGSNYGGHFIMEAEKAGYSLPSGMKTRWVKYQQMQARNWSASNQQYDHPHGTETNEMIQAYRLFVLALSGNAELGAMNRLREEKNLSVAARWRLAAAYKIAGQPEVAQLLIKNISTDIAPYRELSYSYGSDIRDEAMILETLSLMNEKGRGINLAKAIARSLGKDYWYSTQETSYCLMALCKFGNTNLGKEMSVLYTVNKNETKSLTTKKSICQVKYNEKELENKNTVTIKNNGTNTLFVKVITEGIPLVGDKTSSARDLGMLVKYKDMKGNEIQPDKLIQGTDFVAEVTLTNPGTRGFLKEMALSQIFPSGWEIHNARLFETGGATSARYQDIRDDRVYSYYDLAQNTSKTFSVQLNATYLGKFYLPTVYSEAMYDNTINARIPGRWVEVVKNIPQVTKK